MSFPSQATCVEALKTFAAYIQADTETVCLRQAVKRKDGEYVWSIIREDAWDTVMDMQDEEIGVFLPNTSPDRFPYKKVCKVTISYIFFVLLNIELFI